MTRFTRLRIGKKEYVFEEFFEDVLEAFIAPLGARVTARGHQAYFGEFEMTENGWVQV